MKNILLIFTLWVLSLATPAHGQVFNSGTKQVHLVELYTSQSCSSCPPAEAWLSQLKGTKNLWHKYVPLAFHVSYWNHLSWQDPFSKQKYSKRQREINSVIRGGVYTPQVILDGKDHRGWRATSAMTLGSSTLLPGNLKAVVNKDKKSAQLTFVSKSTKSELKCYGAYLESGFNSKITDGENAGKSLRQDFVVAKLFEAHMTTNKLKTKSTCQLALTHNQKSKAKEKALAFWVVDKKTYKVVQATGGVLK